MYLEVKDIKKSYGADGSYIQVLKGISTGVEKGEMCVIQGTSGSGKSTLIRLVNGLETLDSGTVTVHGEELGSLKKPQLRKLRRKIGIVFQDYKLLPKLTVYENVAFALEIYGLPTNEVKRKVLKALDLVGLKSKTKSYPNQLSGGEQQRVAIARAIVNSPKLLICDEPTGNLDPDTSLEVMKVIEKINDLGTTVVMATHDREMVNKMKKRVVLLDNGKLVKDYEKGSYTHYESN